MRDGLQTLILKQNQTLAEVPRCHADLTAEVPASSSRAPHSTRLALRFNVRPAARGHLPPALRGTSGLLVLVACAGPSAGHL